MNGRWYLVWAWVFPLTYLLHIIEEYWGGEGYSAYLLRLRGIHLSSTTFLIAHGFGLVLMVAGIILAWQFKFPNLLIVILASVVLLNGLGHTFISLLYAQYIPGLVTSILIWIPLGGTTLLTFRGRMSNIRYWLSMAIGAAISLAVELVITCSG